MSQMKKTFSHCCDSFNKHTLPVTAARQVYAAPTMYRHENTSDSAVILGTMGKASDQLINDPLPDSADNQHVFNTHGSSVDSNPVRRTPLFVCHLREAIISELDRGIRKDIDVLVEYLGTLKFISDKRVYSV